jgi:hypothetical protein
MLKRSLDMPFHWSPDFPDAREGWQATAVSMQMA